MDAIVEELKVKIEMKEICCDCFSPFADKPRLPCTRNDTDYAQCPDCFETFTQWYMKEIQIEDVHAIFDERRKANGYIFVKGDEDESTDTGTHK